MSDQRSFQLWSFLICSVFLAGCSGGANVVPLPSYDPDGAAAKAIELYDTDGDGQLSETELDAAPGIKAAMRNLDTDSNGQVSEEEIAERVRSWETQQIGLMALSCEVYMDGSPLSGATVTFEPEEILGDSIKKAVGETGLAGTLRPKVPKELRPSPDSPPGVQLGFYRVKVSKMQGGKETIPKRYNAETVLGQQVAKDDYGIVNKQVIFNVKRK